MAISEDPEGHERAAFTAAKLSFTGLRVLEIGCGDGRLTRQYARKAASVVAIDPDARAIARLAAELPIVDARATTFAGFVLPARSVDVALFAWSL
jgi:16S rRNA A1518/A1519 N6-dimethyltransferase RsmA/KsgA/DIM1 with predicted DNA glycosylase/AP lyase activity